jgi:hypothetical protein
MKHDAAAHSYDIHERMVLNGSDHNIISAVCWQRKASTTTTTPAYLLHLQTIHQRHHRYLTWDFYIPGLVNVMADDASLPLSSLTLTPPILRPAPGALSGRGQEFFPQ